MFHSLPEFFNDMVNEVVVYPEIEVQCDDPLFPMSNALDLREIAVKMQRALLLNPDVQDALRQRGLDGQVEIVEIGDDVPERVQYLEDELPRGGTEEEYSAPGFKPVGVSFRVQGEEVAAIMVNKYGDIDSIRKILSDGKLESIWDSRSPREFLSMVRDIVGSFSLLLEEGGVRRKPHSAFEAQAPDPDGAMA